MYHDKIWTDAALEEKEMIGGMGGWSESGVAYQIDIRQTDARAVAKKRTGLDIKLFETLGSYVLIAHMAPQWRYKNIKIYCDNTTTVSSLIKKRGPLNRRAIHYIVDKICMLSVEYQFRFWIEYIKSKKNGVCFNNYNYFEYLSFVFPSH